MTQCETCGCSPCDCSKEPEAEFSGDSWGRHFDPINSRVESLIGVILQRVEPMPIGLRLATLDEVETYLRT